MQLSLVIPAYNEEDRISSVVKSYTAYLNRDDYDYEIIVVCDGTDGTAGIIKDTMKTHHRLKLLEFHKKLGKGGALIQGFKAAGGYAVGFVDSDESIEPGEFRKLVSMLESNDCAIASRYINGAEISVPQPLMRMIASRVFNLLVNLLFSLGLKDTQCGAKAFRRDVIKEVLPFLKSTGFEFDVELIWRIKKRGFAIKEVPIAWKHESGSSFSFWNTPSMFLNLLRLRFA